MDENNFQYVERDTAARRDAFHMTRSQIEAEQQSFISKVYAWMSIALVVTGVTAMYVASSNQLFRLFVTTPPLFYGLMLVEVLMVWYLASAVQNMSASAATTVFLVYSVVNGLTLSVIFRVYTADSIASTFFLTAGTFGVMSAYGYFTKADLTSMGNLFMMLLVGLLMASVLNLFMQSSALYWATTYAGILIFVGLTAYDTQKIKEMNIIGNEGTEEDQKEAIMGALTLYLDFINLFLYLLRLFGTRRND